MNTYKNDHAWPWWTSLIFIIPHVNTGRTKSSTRLRTLFSFIKKKLIHFATGRYVIFWTRTIHHNRVRWLLVLCRNRITTHHGMAYRGEPYSISHWGNPMVCWIGRSSSLWYVATCRNAHYRIYQVLPVIIFLHFLCLAIIVNDSSFKYLFEFVFKDLVGSKLIFKCCSFLP